VSLTAPVETTLAGATTELLARLNEQSGAGPWAEMGTAVSFYWEPLLHQHRLAAMAFAGATGVLVGATHAVREPMERLSPIEPVPTTTTMVPDPALVAAAADAPSLRAVEQIRGWLGVSYDAIAKMAGMGSASLFYYWKRQQAKGLPINPRPATIAPLLRLHAFVHALVETLEGEPGALGAQVWVRTKQHGQRPLDFLLAGRLDDAEALGRDLLFASPAADKPAWRAARLQQADPEPAPSAGAPSYQASDFA
jgi:AcrR family transcriptional regulator